MAILKLLSLYCIETEDNWGSDEAFIRVNDLHVWGPVSINDNESRGIDVEVAFETNASISLFDADSPDGPDHLGTHTASSEEAGRGETHVYFYYDDAYYRLIYTVHAN